MQPKNDPNVGAVNEPDGEPQVFALEASGLADYESALIGNAPLDPTRLAEAAEEAELEPFDLDFLFFNGVEADLTVADVFPALASEDALLQEDSEKAKPEDA